MMSLHGSPTEVEEEQVKRQQHLAYATPTTSSSFFIPSTTYLTLQLQEIGDVQMTHHLL